jgi:hypothetical protein
MVIYSRLLLFLEGKSEADSEEARSRATTESHSDGQNVGYFSGTLQTVLLALGYSEPRFSSVS